MRRQSLSAPLALAALCWLLASPASSQDGQVRAGYPLETSRWAIPSDTGAYQVNLVGGGSARRRRADPPLAHEGTWGWDYRGRQLPRHVFLGWWHGRRYQGGTGAY